MRLDPPSNRRGVVQARKPPTQHPRNRPMRSLPTIKNITVAFSEDEYPLFEAFERLRQRDYQTRAGWIKSTIYKSLPEDERLNLFAEQ